MSNKFEKNFQEKLTKINNVIELVRHRALQQPNRRVYKFLADGEIERSNWTYGELDQKARAIAFQRQSLNATGGCCIRQDWTSLQPSLGLVCRSSIRWLQAISR